MPFFKPATILFLVIASTTVGQQPPAADAVVAKPEATTTSTTPTTGASAIQPVLRIKVEEIAKHVGQVVAVEYDVLSTSLIDSKKICFLNSKRKWRDKGNFATIIKSDTLAEFANAKIPDPGKYYYQKRIRVQGKVTLHRENPQIVVSKVNQITILKPLKKEAPAASKESPSAGNAVKAD